MRFTDDVLNRHAGRQVHLDIEGIRWKLALVQIRVCHPRLGIGGTLVCVAGPHHSGIDKLVHRILRNEQFCIEKFHLDHIFRKDVCHIHLKNVRPVLFQQACAPAVVLCLLVFLPRCLPRLDIRHDCPLADGHLHAVDGRTRGCGKDVDRLQRGRSRIFIDLSHPYIRDYPGDIHIH